jgi:hypothetical protein
MRHFSNRLVIPHPIVVSAHITVAEQVKAAKARVRYVASNPRDIDDVADVRREAAAVVALETSLREASYRVTR